MGFRRQARRLSQKHGEDLRSNFVGSVEFDDKMLADKPSYSNPISLDAKMFWNTIWVYTVPGDEERTRRELQFIENECARNQMLRELGLIRDTPASDDTHEN